MAKVTLLLGGLVLLASLGACGEDDAATPEPAGCAVTEIDVRHPGVTVPVRGVYFGQEIWLSYKSEAHKGQGFRYPRDKDLALHKARGLCRQVHAGADIGPLARKWSNASMAQADGFVALPLPMNKHKPDARDIALMNTPVGEVSPLIEWRGGYWFAKRVSDTVGRALGAQLERATKVRARARVIHIHHAGAFPRRVEFDEHPKAKAIATARWIIQEAQRGVDFAKLAKKWSNDVSRNRGGLLMTKHPITKEPTEWVRWGDRNFPQPVLDVMLEKGTPGEVWPEPVVSGLGVDVVFLLERRED